MSNDAGAERFYVLVGGRDRFPERTAQDALKHAAEDRNTGRSALAYREVWRAGRWVEECIEDLDALREDWRS